MITKSKEVEETKEVKKDAYENSRQPTPKEIEIAQIKMLKNLKNEVEYFELLARLQTAKKTLGVFTEQMMMIKKQAVDATLQAVDAGVRKREVYEKLGIVDYENPVISADSK